MNHRSVIAAVLGVGFILTAALPAAADPWGRGGRHGGHGDPGYGHGHRGHDRWAHDRRAYDRWEHRHRPHYRPHHGYYGYAPSAYHAPPAVYLGLPGIGPRIQ